MHKKNKEKNHRSIPGGLHKMVPHTLVVAGIVWRDQTFLATSRPAGKTWAGYWEFPGGKVEAGEPPEKALQRELQEELGIVAHDMLFWQTVEHEYPEVTVRLSLYHVLRFSGSLLGKEGQLLRWVTPEQARGMQFLPADTPLLADLKAPM